MNSLEEYRKYKKMYISFKKMNQNGGAFNISLSINENLNDFIANRFTLDDLKQISTQINDKVNATIDPKDKNIYQIALDFMKHIVKLFEHNTKLSKSDATVLQKTTNIIYKILIEIRKLLGNDSNSAW